MISTKNVEEQKDFVSNFIKPGIGVYRIAHMEAHTPDMGSHGIKLFMESRPMEELKDEPQKGEFILYTTENATKYTLAQIQAIGKACGISKEEMDNITAATWDEYIALVKPLIANKFLRVKFRGEEVLSKNTGKKWLKASLPTFRFVESEDTSPSTLLFTPEKDIKKLPDYDVETMADGATTSADKKDDLPF